MRFLKSEAGAIIVWLVASLLAAALLSPWLYVSGQRLVENASVYDYPGFMKSLAAACDRAKPDRYFSRALLLSALVLIPFLVRRVRLISQSDVDHPYALRQQPASQKIIHVTSGLLISMGTIFVLWMMLTFTGAMSIKEANLSLSKMLTKALLPALGAGLVEEFLFRGLLLGLWLRACSVRAAWVGSSLVFAFLHFLKPPSGMIMADPAAWYSGFEILANTLGHFANPLFFITQFTTLAVFGLILAYCRTRTFSLWLPFGLHAGLVFSFKILSMTQQLNLKSSLVPWCIGRDLKSGIFPLLALGLCFAACVIFVRKFSRAERSEQPLS